MSRKLQNIINNDPEIIQLRMKVEDLINTSESYSDTTFQTEGYMLESAIDKRINAIILENTKNKKD